ncbi:hypothetical protein NUU61_004217 [Penicillium alfredii]|uniref:Uncharacterized protein n=1 Tax=Penicillium alfredii TaxID=1506179 RepID=A0A9W9FKS7_9EURO|nr:uncharacterized protein NUU61_004217 [Penicillium alfredii]KAJ5101995.1 hypothetical protein NUU61_004217 [Penicillium alfredii]
MASTKNTSPDIGYTFPPFESCHLFYDSPRVVYGDFSIAMERKMNAEFLSADLKNPALNLLTPSVVLEVSKEVKFGQHVQLYWLMENLEFPGFGRIPIHHHVKDMTSQRFIRLDDEISVNMQSSSQ